MYRKGGESGTNGKARQEPRSKKNRQEEEKEEMKENEKR